MKEKIKTLILYILKKMDFIPLVRIVLETKGTQTPVRLKMWFFQKVLGFNKSAYWPTHFTSIIYNPKNIYCGIDTSPGYMPGCYIQAAGKVYIDDYTQIASNVGIITINHNIYDTRKHTTPLDTRLGKYCWIGMNSVILPGVVLGDHTVVGAGSVVTRSYPEGYCVIVGNPAKKIRDIDSGKCVMFKNIKPYNGFIRNSEFNNYRKKHLCV